MLTIVKRECKKYPINCRKEKSENCLTKHTDGSIRLKDGKSRSLTINNPGLKPYHQILVDGCLVKSGTKDIRCDWMIYNPDNKMVCLVELKSSVGETQLKKALNQFEDTIHTLKPQNYANLKLILVFHKFTGNTARLEFKKGLSQKHLSKKYWDKFFTYSKENYQGNPKHAVVVDYDDIFSPIKPPSKAKP